MSSIITLTFSPCIDKSSAVEVLAPETKLKCAEPKLEPGGGGINVARAIRKLGGSATAIFPEGGYTGKYFTAMLEKEGIPCSYVETRHETRENFILFENSSGKQYRFGMPPAPLEHDEYDLLIAKLAQHSDARFVIVSGSVAPGVPESVFRSLAATARLSEANLITDVSGPALFLALKEKPFLIKPNLGELAQLTGHTYLNHGEIIPAAKALIHEYGCRNIVVSMGAEGACLVSEHFVLLAKPPAVEVKSTVGAGDSMVAGIVYQLSAGAEMPAAFRFGVACGTAATLHRGTELCNRQDADAIAALVELRAL